MLDHENRVRNEFARQAETFFGVGGDHRRCADATFITALGEVASGSVLDVACGPAKNP
jgi:hypothetical protein